MGRGRTGWQQRGLMLSVRLCLSSALGVLHRSFHGKCTGTDYHRLERERARETGASRVWVCDQKMSVTVSSLQIPDYAFPLLYHIPYLFTLVFSRFAITYAALWRKKLAWINCLTFPHHQHPLRVGVLKPHHRVLVSTSPVTDFHQDIPGTSMRPDLEASANTALCCALCVQRFTTAEATWTAQEEAIL